MPAYPLAGSREAPVYSRGLSRLTEFLDDPEPLSLQHNTFRVGEHVWTPGETAKRTELARTSAYSASVIGICSTHSLFAHSHTHSGTGNLASPSRSFSTLTRSLISRKSA